MYKLTYGLQKIGDYKNFKEAFIELYNRLQKDLNDEGGMSYQFLETAIWIEVPHSVTPLFFYEARDHACRIGLLQNGKLVPDFEKQHRIVEGQLNGGEKVVTCPKCGSEHVMAVQPFDYVKQCMDCEEQFSSGVHN